MKLIRITLLLPLLFEILDQSSFRIGVPGFPLSLGKICFVIFGIIGLNKSSFSGNKLYLLLIPLGYFFSALGSEDVLGNISASLGVFMLIIGSVGVIDLLCSVKFDKALFLSCILLFGYWSYYVLELYVSGKLILGLGFNSPNQMVETVNHHMFGSLLTFATVFLFLSFFNRTRGYKMISVIILLIGLASILISESRSNVLAISIVLVVYVVQKNLLEQRSSIGLVISLASLIGGGVLLFNVLFADNERINERFDTNEEDLINSNQSRLGAYVTFFENVGSVFLIGNGEKNRKIVLRSGRVMLSHNFYISTFVAGGVFSFIGMVFFPIKVFGALFRTEQMKLLFRSDFHIALFFSCLSIFISVLFYDVGGLFLYVLLSFSGYLFEIDKIKEGYDS